jgi:hypothetical protein
MTQIMGFVELGRPVAATGDLVESYGPRLKLMPEKDRWLLELLLSGRMSLRAVSRLLRINPGSLHRRYRKLRQRLDHPVVRALAAYGSFLDPLHTEFARRHYVLGRPLLVVAGELLLGRREAQALAEALEEWARGPGPVLTRSTAA